MNSEYDTSITKIYEQKKTTDGTEEEALEYIKVLDKHDSLQVIFPESEDQIKLSNNSWEVILKKIPEEKIYSLGYIVFSATDEIEEDDVWGIKKHDTEETTMLKDVFFISMLDTAKRHEVPFEMTEEDFSKFTDYFNKKESKENNLLDKLELPLNDDIQSKIKNENIEIESEGVPNNFP